jgi:hypothetical protein
MEATGMGDHQEALPDLCALPIPVEDAGANAQANFRYQCEAIACWCYRLLDEHGPLAVLCEYHEDFVVLHHDRDVELVAVKHRDRNRGAWAFGDLCDKGGLVHLFDRWHTVHAAGHPARAMHLTNAGLASGAGNAAELAELCRADHQDPDRNLAWAKSLARQALRVAAHREVETIPRRSPPPRPEHLADDDPLVLRAAEFLRCLRFTVTADRDHIAAVTIHDMVIPWFKQQGWNHFDAAQSHDRVVTLIDEAVRSHAGQSIPLVRYGLDPDAWSTTAARDRRVAARTIDAERILAVLSSPCDAPPLFRTDRTPVPAPGGAGLRRKMAAGRLSTAKHEWAERLRSAWYTTRAGQLPDLPGDAAMVAQIETEVLELVIEAQDTAAIQCPAPDPGHRFAPALLAALRQGLTVDRFQQRPPLAINDRHAVGVAFDLSDQCYFGFEHPEPVTADATDAPGHQPSDGSGHPGGRDA